MLMLTLPWNGKDKIVTRGHVQNLKPFKPGQSGNPGGRPKKDLASIIASEVFAENPEAIKAGLVKALRRGDSAVFKALADKPSGDYRNPLLCQAIAVRPSISSLRVVRLIG